MGTNMYFVIHEKKIILDVGRAFDLDDEYLHEAKRLIDEFEAYQDDIEFKKVNELTVRDIEWISKALRLAEILASDFWRLNVLVIYENLKEWYKDVEVLTDNDAEKLDELKDYVVISI